MEKEHKKPLLMDSLGERDAVLLATLPQYEGYKVLVRLMVAGAKQFTDRHMKLDPMTEKDYDSKVKLSHYAARCVNEFCGDIFKSVDWHTQKVMLDQSAAAIEAALEEVPEQVPTANFRSQP